MRLRKLFIAIISICLLALTACGKSSISKDEYVSIMEKNGYSIGVKYETTEELETANNLLKLQIQTLDKYELFDFNITYSISYNKGELENFCSTTWTEFETESQARSYYQYCLDTRSESNKWKNAILGNIVIGANNEEIIKELKLNFK